jgi:diguanylate cyclase (GGDEF)-like protein
MENALRIQTICFSLIVIAILWFSGDRRRTFRMEIDSRLYRLLLVSTAFMLVVDTISWFFDGRPGDFARGAIFAANLLYFLVHTFPVAFFVLYSDYQIFKDEKRFRKFAPPLALIELFSAALAVISLFNGALFTVDEATHYMRGPWFPAFAAFQYGIVAFVLVHVIRHRKKANKRVFVSLLAYPLPLLIAALIQMRFVGLTLIWPATTLFLVVAAFNLENRRSKTDYLTGVANRRSLDEELERRIASGGASDKLCGLLLDVDDFKTINDRFGHEAGDMALEDVANILLTSVRANDCVARMGGDEFVVLAELHDEVEAQAMVRRIELAIGHHNASSNRPYQLSVSIGRLGYDRGKGADVAAGAAEFLSRLDADMYSRKKARGFER